MCLMRGEGVCDYITSDLSLSPPIILSVLLVAPTRQESLLQAMRAASYFRRRVGHHLQHA